MNAIRKVTPADIATVVSYIEKRAEFDRSLGCFDGALGATPEKLAKALFEDPVFAHALLAVSDQRSLGFAFYHFRFSSFQARPSLWLDDLYVDADVRRSGAGIALMNALAAEAAMQRVHSYCMDSRCEEYVRHSILYEAGRDYRLAERPATRVLDCARYAQSSDC